MSHTRHLVDSAILLESGTNEVEVLVFRVGQLTLGINVAKVREILTVPRMTRLPGAHQSMCGCFQLRNIVVPCVSLHRHLGEEPHFIRPEMVVILTEFNQFQLGFVVDVVERIHRISWGQVTPAPSCIANGTSPVTAIGCIDGRLVSMLDFETIADQVAHTEQACQAVANSLGVDRGQHRIAIADDSPTARQAVKSVLHTSGYRDLFTFENGATLWQWLTSELEQHPAVTSPASLVITDIEMPVTDGLHLTRSIKEHPRLRHIPVLLYSSILTPDNQKKGRAVSADAQITKPELQRVVNMADQLIHDAGRRNSAADSDFADPIPHAVTTDRRATNALCL